MILSACQRSTTSSVIFFLNFGLRPLGRGAEALWLKAKALVTFSIYAGFFSYTFTGLNLVATLAKGLDIALAQLPVRSYKPHPEVCSFQNCSKVCTCALPPLKPAKIATSVSVARKPNGTALPPSTTAWSAWQSSICARAPKSIPKASCKPVSGRTKAARTAIQPISCCRALAPL